MSGLFGAYKNKILRKISSQQDLHPSASKHLKSIEKINQNTLIQEAKYLVFDTELTGLSIKKDSIVSIGALKMHGGKIDLNETYYRVVDPRAKLTGQSVLIHGITPSEASECPKIEMLLPEFLDFCGNSIIVGHFVAIDLAFINKEMTKLFGFPLQNPAIDTRKVYQWIRKNEEQFCSYHAGLSEKMDLLSLADKYAIPVNKAHHALDDAFVTAQLFQRFLTLTTKFGAHTVADLVSIGRP
jgi:DNA polymerase III subunit epsilon